MEILSYGFAQVVIENYLFSVWPSAFQNNSAIRLAFLFNVGMRAVTPLAQLVCVITGAHVAGRVSDFFSSRSSKRSSPSRIVSGCGGHPGM